jgi:hypothetical protein
MYVYCVDSLWYDVMKYVFSMSAVVNETDISYA